MSNHYTDADVQTAIAALVEQCASHYPENPAVREFAARMFGESDPTVTTVLDAVAPAIAARALREAADAIDADAETVRELADRFGGYYGGVHSTKRAAATSLRARADEIEAR